MTTTDPAAGFLDEHQHQGDNPGLVDDVDGHREAAEDFAQLATEASSRKERLVLAQLATAHAMLHIGDMLAALLLAVTGPGLDEVLAQHLGPRADGTPDLSPLLPCGAYMGALPCMLPVHGAEQDHVFGGPADGAE